MKERNRSAASQNLKVVIEQAAPVVQTTQIPGTSTELDRAELQGEEKQA